MQPVADRDCQQLVPGRVEVDLVDPVATRIVAAQHRLIDVGQPGLLLRPGGPGQPTELVQLVGDPAAALAVHRRQQGRIVSDVVIR